jgi:AAA+ superfamily predicted ATPase
LQEVDDWPSTGLLVAATNHAELLDPAVWRRFEMAIEFAVPTRTDIMHLVMSLLKAHSVDAEMWAGILSFALKGKSHNDIEREIILLRRSAVTSGLALDDLLKTLIRVDDRLSRSERIELARELERAGVTSQREAQRITGVSRDTIRKVEAASKSRRRKESA